MCGLTVYGNFLYIFHCLLRFSLLRNSPGSAWRARLGVFESVYVLAWAKAGATMRVGG